MTTTPMKTIPLHPTTAPPTAARAARWQWHRLHDAPHRLAFAAGTALMMLAALWWAATLAARAAGWAGPTGVPPSTVHALVMAWGFMPLFFAGFLFTAGPRWLALPPVPARAIARGVQAQGAGWALLLAAPWAADPALARTLAALGVAAAAAGWGTLVWRFVGMCRRSPAPDRLHAALIAAAGTLGAGLMAAAAGALAADDFGLLHALVRAGLWGFIGITFAVVAHRMIPFFSAAALPMLDAWRPTWLLWVFVGVLAFEALAVAVPVAPALQAAVEALAALLWLALALRWGLLQSLRVRLLAMLHLGFFWLGVAMALAAAGHALQAIGGPSLGLAPLHAFTMGFLGSTLLAMATRVSAGHSGRTLVADNLAWALFWLLQAAVIARIMSDMVGAPAVWLAAALWAAAVLAWGARHLRWYGRPRIDGRPG